MSRVGNAQSPPDRPQLMISDRSALPRRAYSLAFDALLDAIGVRQAGRVVVSLVRSWVDCITNMLGLDWR
jgi:hypothetical protein